MTDSNTSTASGATATQGAVNMGNSDDSLHHEELVPPSRQNTQTQNSGK
ncbi:MAG: hypothetical protein H7249_12895 [Chitinophagaceae bacterium]|nr:hypothetical protein [Oligoflexus sp.]